MKIFENQRKSKGSGSHMEVIWRLFGDDVEVIWKSFGGHLEIALSESYQSRFLALSCLSGNREAKSISLPDCSSKFAGPCAQGVLDPPTSLVLAPVLIK